MASASDEPQGVDFQLTDEQMARIAALDTGATLFFDHWLNSRADD